MEAGFPAGEKIHVLNAGGDPRGDGARLEPDGDEEDVIEGEPGGAVEGEAELGLEEAAFADAAAGEAGEEEVGDLDGAFDGAGPILSGEEFHLIEPGVETGGGEVAVEAFDEGEVLVGVGDEDLGAGIGQEADAAAGVAAEDAEPVDFDGETFLEAAPEDTA